MNTQQLELLISTALRPEATESSLIMCATALLRSSREDLEKLLLALCQENVTKVPAVIRCLPEDVRLWAEDLVQETLAQHCHQEENFTSGDLLAIGICNQCHLLEAAAPMLTQELIDEAFSAAEATVACQLLQMSLLCLPEELCALFRAAFSRFLIHYSSRMDKALSQLLPTVLEQDAADVLSALIENAGAEKIALLCQTDLAAEAERLILSGKDSTALWDLSFTRFFSTPRTPEELLVQGLWQIQLYASDEILDDVCSIFYLYVALHYGVDHPIFAYILDFEAPEEYTRTQTLRYRDALDALWEQPEALSRFLDKTAICNPFLQFKIHEDGYDLLKSAQNPTAFRRLSGLFTLDTPASSIINIFLSTDLRQELPLEDVLYLAQRNERLPEFLEFFKTMPLMGVVTRQRSNLIVLSPLSYHVTTLHTLRRTYHIAEGAEGKVDLKGKEYPYTITAFVEGHIYITPCNDPTLAPFESAATLSWPEAVEELDNALSLPKLSDQQMQQLSILDFSLDSLTEENDLNLLTQVIMNHQAKLPKILELLNLCKWNTCFTTPDFRLPSNMFGLLKPYREQAAELFRSLLATFPDTAPVLSLYFSSIYRAIVPLSLLLAFQEKEILLAYLHNYPIYCRLLDPGNPLCRLSNITCAPICSVDNIEGITSRRAFAAIISDFQMQDNHVHRITLQRYTSVDEAIRERGAVFGHIAKNIPINYNRVRLIQNFPSTAQYTPREIMFNLLCMEKAIYLRRTNHKELMFLLETMGHANPFAFQNSTIADWIYLRDFRPNRNRMKNIPDTAISLVLNARDIAAVEDLYLNTNMKFYLTLPKFAELLQARNPALARQIPALFEETEFLAVADYDGCLWLPYVAQNALKVDTCHRGKVLRCRIHLDLQGQMQVTVLSQDNRKSLLDIVISCLLMGYCNTPAMDNLLRSPVMKLFNDDPLLLSEPGQIMDRKNILKVVLRTVDVNDAPATRDNFSALEKRLRKQLQRTDFLFDKFAKEINKAIRKYNQVLSAQEMADSIGLLLSECIAAHPVVMDGVPLIKGIRDCFQSHFQSTLLDTPCAQLLAKLKTPIVQPSTSVVSANSLEESVQNLWNICYDTSLTPNILIKNMRKLLRKYHTLVPQEEMYALLLKFTAVWIPRSISTSLFVSLLRGLVSAYANCYQSLELSTGLLDQAAQYLDSKALASLRANLEQLSDSQ